MTKGKSLFPKALPTGSARGLPLERQATLLEARAAEYRAEYKRLKAIDPRSNECRDAKCAAASTATMAQEARILVKAMKKAQPKKVEEVKVHVVDEEAEARDA